VWENPARAVNETAGKLAGLDGGKKRGECGENPSTPADEFREKLPASHSLDPRFFLAGREGKEPNKAKSFQ